MLLPSNIYTIILATVIHRYFNISFKDLFSYYNLLFDFIIYLPSFFLISFTLDDSSFIQFRHKDCCV